MPAPIPRRMALPAMIIVSLLLGLLVGFAGDLVHAASPVARIVGGFIILAAMIAAWALCIWWWRTIDEAAREAHKWAWWWGGSGGMVVGMALMMLLTFRPSLIPAGLTGATPGETFVAGIITVVVFQLIGYGVAWAAWWLQRR